MKYWADFYEKLFNFREIRYFDIKGEYTGLTSQALTAPDGKIRIPLNEEAEGGKGQIEEFLREYNGEGIQHIALICDDLVEAYDKLKARGVPMMTPPPDTYYEMLSADWPGLLRVHPAQGRLQAGLRRRQLQGLVRKHGT